MDIGQSYVQGSSMSFGHRVELVSMDAHCRDITVALYRRDDAEIPIGLVHTYSRDPDAAARVAFLARAMVALGGLELGGNRDGRPGDAVRFACGTWHAAAIKRLFLEAAKLSSAEEPVARPLEVIDSKSGLTIRVIPLGAGQYRVTAGDDTDEATARASSVASGLVKLAELERSEDQTVVGFPCGWDHDPLVGLLLVRALNLRAVLREAEVTASRGVLVAPSAQE
jgi:hypothetical protein